MQTVDKFRLKYPTITDQVITKATLILTSIGHKPTEWEEEPFEHHRLGFIRTPRARCHVPNCDDVFGLLESRYPKAVQMVRFYPIENTRKMVMIELMFIPDLSIEDVRNTIYASTIESVKKAYCVRYRNLK